MTGFDPLLPSRQADILDVRPWLEVMGLTTAEDVEAHEHQAWQAAADTYAEVTGFATALGGQLELVLELGGVSNSSTVLDAGCGPGQLTGALQLHAGSVAGIDFSAEMISEARKRYPQIDFREANVEDLPYEIGSFDVVVCCYVANHFARPEIAFRELRRVLHTDGRLVVISPIQQQMVSFGTLMEALAETLPQTESKPFPSGPLSGVTDPDVYSDLLTKAGFVTVSAEVRVKPLIQRDLDTMCRSLWYLAGLASQSETTQQKIRARIEELSTTYRLPDGSYSFPDQVIACVAS